jgi:REP element-mobilizing transposase RayT
MSAPLAYHLTWTAYGSWLHGDPRGWVMKGVSCILPEDECRRQRVRLRMIERPVEFTPEQRVVIERTIVEHCERRGWPLHARNARSNHVHLVVSSELPPEPVMNQIKGWCSRRLSDDAELPLGGVRGKRAGRRKWFTEHGSTMWINDEDYLRHAIRYVSEGQ